MVEGDGTHDKKQLLDGLFDEALVHAMVAHVGMEDGEQLQDGGDGVCLCVLISTVGTLPEARWLHARNSL